MENQLDYKEFYNRCINITNKIINIYKKLLHLELNGEQNSYLYKIMVLQLKEKIKEEKNLYILAYNLIGDNWDDLETAGEEILFEKYNEKPEILWFLPKDALKKNLDFRLERRIFGNIYTNVYGFLDEYENEIDEDIEYEVDEDIENFDFDDSCDAIDLSFLDIIEDDYLLIFMHLLKEYLDINSSKLSIETYKELLEVKYDLAFVEVKYEEQFINDNFIYSDEIKLSAQLEAEIRSYSRASNLDNKSKLFEKNLKCYQKMIYEDSVRVLGESLQNLENSIQYSEAIKIINFLYLKAVLYSGYCKKELIIQKLNSYKGKNDELDMYINELLDCNTLDKRIYTFSLYKNKRTSND